MRVITGGGPARRAVAVREDDSGSRAPGAGRREARRRHRRHGRRQLPADGSFEEIEEVAPPGTSVEEAVREAESLLQQAAARIASRLAGAGGN